MFKRILIEDWMLCLPFFAFFLFAAIFALISFCALRLRKSERVRLASMPLDEPAASPSIPATDN